ncbi:MAG: dihydrodipicolinate synthase family protein [Ignavibacteriota bacterium]
MKTLSKIEGLQGVHAAAITPRGKNGDINFGAVFDLIDYLSAAHVNGIALFTACGEYPALAVDDRARLTYLAVKRSRVPRARRRRKCYARPLPRTCA